MIFLTLVFAYLIGSIPFGLLLTRAAGLGDVRKLGSGNIGATNVLRTGNKWLALLTLLLDMGKGYAAVRLGYELGGRAGYAIDCALLASLIVVLGHMFPVWLKGKGGKGVATAIGAFFGLAPWLGLVTGGIWLTCFVATRISSASALVSIGAMPVLCLIWGRPEMLLPTLPIALLVIWRHKENIRRIKNGTEPRFKSR